MVYLPEDGHLSHIAIKTAVWSRFAQLRSSAVGRGFWREFYVVGSNTTDSQYFLSFFVNSFLLALVGLGLELVQCFRVSAGFTVEIVFAKDCETAAAAKQLRESAFRVRLQCLQ